MYLSRDGIGGGPIKPSTRIDHEHILCPFGHTMEIKYSGDHTCDGCAVFQGENDIVKGAKIGHVSVKRPCFWTCQRCNYDRCLTCAETEYGKRGRNITIRCG